MQRTNVLLFYQLLLQHIRLKFAVFDYDRHTKTAEIGSTSVVLKDIKNLATADEKITITNFLTHKKQVL